MPNITIINQITVYDTQKETTYLILAITWRQSTYKRLLRQLCFSYLPVHCLVQFWHLSTPTRCHPSHPTQLQDQYQTGPRELYPTGLREQYPTGPRDHFPTGHHQILAGTHRRMTGNLHRNSPMPEQNNSLTYRYNVRYQECYLMILLFWPFSMSDVQTLD